MAFSRFEYAPTPVDEPSPTEYTWNVVSESKDKKYPVTSEAERSRASSWESQPDQPNVNKGWKPLSMTAPILASIGTFSLLMAAAVEVVAQQSAKQGALALSPSVDEIPRYAMLSYLYVPQILAVVYSLTWNWVDLDVKRMQPWFELSKPEGAKAINSLFLDYPYDFIALVPFKAAKERHWMAFLSGTAMMIVFWAISPLQSSILGIDTISITKPVEMGPASQLLPLSKQLPLLGPEILNTGYAISWLGQSYPAFTNSDYGLLPFYLDNNTAPTRADTNWTANTMKYTTELDCWPAQVSSVGVPRVGQFSFLNRQGCNTTIAPPRFNNFTMSYIPYGSSPYSSYALDSPTCPPTSNNTHQFLAVMGQSFNQNASEPVDFDLTALYCQPYYYKQKVRASVKASNFEPIRSSIHPLGQKELLTEDEFNSTAFEFLLGNGIDQNPRTRDYPFDNAMELNPLVEGRNISTPIDNMVGFALAGKRRPTEDYKNPEVLRKAFEDAHKSLFSVALNTLLTNTTTTGGDSSPTSTYFLSGIKASREFCASVEACLILTSIFSFLILYLCHTTPCHLTANPSSISRMAQVFRNSPELLDAFRGSDTDSSKALTQKFSEEQFRLLRENSGISPRANSMMIERVASDLSDRSEPVSEKSEGYYDPVRPLVLTTPIGIFFFCVLAAAIAGLAYMYHQITIQGGIPRASENFNVNQILENYLPTIFATLVEPFWVLLNRFLCVLQPFKELWGGKAGTSNSIDTTYTSIPPQLVVWRALKNKHFLLAVVCVVSLLGNVLAVGLSALFNEKPVRVIQETTARPLLSTTFDNETVSEFNTYMMEITTRTSYTDHMYIAMANITTGNKLPAWVSEDYFFQPYEVAAASNLTTTTYNLITRGFGARGNCTAIPAATIPADINVADPANATDCHDPVALAKSRIRNDMNTQPTPGDAVEYVNTMTPASFSEAIQCDLPLTLAWGRTSKGTGKKAEIDATFAACRPTFETGMFNVTVDRDGTVLSYSPVGETSNTLDYPGSKRHTDLLMVYFNYQLNGDADDFHNDTLTRDWVNYLIYASTGSRGIVDPTKPLPEPSYFIPKVESIYRLLFATILGLNRQLFNGIEETSQNSTVTVRMTSSDTRIFMDGPAFIMTMVVLAINLIVAAVFYTKADALVLPRMPTTIGSILAYVAPSRAVKDLDEKLVSQNSRTYSFGRYVGQDGDVHVGIELDPHVVPVEITSLKEPGSFRRRFTSNSGKSVDGKRPFRAGTWL